MTTKPRSVGGRSLRRVTDPSPREFGREKSGATALKTRQLGKLGERILRQTIAIAYTEFADPVMNKARKRAHRLDAKYARELKNNI
jgi:hypothetical protein